MRWCAWSRATTWPARLDPLPLVLGRFPAKAESRRAGARHRGAGVPDDGGRVEAHRPRRDALLRPRAVLPGVRRGGAAADAGAVLLQLAARRLPHLPGLRPGDRHRPPARDPRPAADARRAPDRALEHAGLRGALRRAARRLPQSASCHSTCPGRTCRRRTASGSGAATGEFIQPRASSSPGWSSAPTRCTCACCSPATAPTTPARTAAAPACSPRRWPSTWRGGPCRT